MANKYLQIRLLKDEMMTSRYLSALLLLLFALIFNSCRKTDAQRPTLEVFAPADNQSFVACDEVVITGRAKDNRGLAEVTASLRDPFNAQLGSSVVALSGTDSEFTLRLKLGDRYTPTMDYYLMVTAFDQSGNSALETIPLSLTELPRVFERVAWVGEDASGGASLFFPDSLGNVQAGPFLGTQLSDVVVDNKNRLLLVAELYGGKFTGRQLGEYEQEFQVNLPTGNQVEGITDISASGNFYLAVSVPPYLRVFDPLGDQIEAWDQVLYPAKQVLAREDDVIVSVRGITGSPVKTDRHRESSRELLSTNFLGWVSEHLLELGDGNVLAAGNESGQGRIRVLDGLTLFDQAAADLAEELLGIDGEGTDWFALTPSGVWRFNPANGTLTGPQAIGSFSSIAWEAEAGNIYLGRENAVDVYSADGTLLRTYTGGFGMVKWIDFQYNK